MRYAIYSRKSRFTGKGESVENQVYMCREYLDGRFPDDGKIIEVFEDDGFSGKNINRPEFRRMLAAVNKKEFDYIVCYRLDRISRSVGDFAVLIDSLSRLGVEFICIREQFDTTNPMGRAMMHIASVFAQLERETIAERIRDNMTLLAKTGRWLGGTTPFGYESVQLKNINLDGKIKASFKLAPIPEEIDIVRIMYDKYSECGSLSGVEAYLAQNGIVTRNGKGFKTVGIREILSNPVYCIADEKAYDYFYENGASISGERKDFAGKLGIAAYNRTKSTGSRQQKQPLSEWIIAVGKHEGIIGSSQWLGVNRDISRNRLAYGDYKPQNPVALLSGVLTCEKCGSPMRPRVSSYHSYKKGRPYEERTYTYKCEMKRISKKIACDCPDINGNTLDKIIWNELSKLMRTEPALEKRLKALRSSFNVIGSAETKKIRLLERRIEDKNIEIKRLITVLSMEPENSVLHQFTKREVEGLAEQIASLKRELSGLENKPEQARDGGVRHGLDADALLRPQQVFDMASVAEKRALIKALTERITWDGVAVNVFLYGEAILREYPDCDCGENLSAAEA